MPGLLQIAQELTLCLSARVTPLMIGERGIGKSALVRELSFSRSTEFAELRRELWGDDSPTAYINLRGSLHEAADFSGLPFLNETADGKLTDFAPPTILPQAGIHGERGLLFLDELFRAQYDVQQAVFQLIEHQRDAEGNWYHRCGRYVLPTGWRVVAASNPPQGASYSQNALLDDAFLDRFCLLEVEVDDDYLLGWADYLGRLAAVDSVEVGRVLAYTADHDAGSMFLGRPMQLDEQDQEPVDNGLMITPSPRSWEAVIRVNSVALRLGLHGGAAHRRVLGGLIGAGLVAGLLDTEPMLTLERVIENPREDWEDEVLNLGRNGVRQLVWGLMGWVERIKDQRRRVNVMELLDLLLGPHGAADCYDLALGLLRSVARSGARELGICEGYGVAVLNGPASLRRVLEAVTPEHDHPGAWLRLLSRRDHLCLASERLISLNNPKLEEQRETREDEHALAR